MLFAPFFGKVCFCLMRSQVHPDVFPQPQMVSDCTFDTVYCEQRGDRVILISFGFEHSELSDDLFRPPAFGRKSTFPRFSRDTDMENRLQQKWRVFHEFPEERRNRGILSFVIDAGKREVEVFRACLGQVEKLPFLAVFFLPKRSCRFRIVQRIDGMMCRE